MSVKPGEDHLRLSDLSTVRRLVQDKEAILSRLRRIEARIEEFSEIRPVQIPDPKRKRRKFSMISRQKMRAAQRARWRKRKGLPPLLPSNPF